MAEGVNFVLVRTVFGAVLGMFYFGFNTGVVNAPAASIKQFTNSSYHQHYDSWLSGDKVETIFTVITSAFIGTASSHHTIQCNLKELCFQSEEWLVPWSEVEWQTGWGGRRVSC